MLTTDFFHLDTSGLRLLHVLSSWRSLAAASTSSASPHTQRWRGPRKRGERKHQIAEDYLAEHTVDRGVFLILVARAVAPVWEATRSTGGVLCNLTKKRAFVNHYSFHIMDPECGHMTIKMSGHPPFGAQMPPGDSMSTSVSTRLPSPGR